MVGYLLVSALVLAPIFLLLKIFFEIFELPSGEAGVASTINIIFVFTLNVGFLLGAWFTLKWVDRRPAALVGMNFWRTSPKEFLIGSGIGLGNFAIIYLILLLFGQISIQSVNITSMDVSLFLKNFTAILMFATIEELINRGYMFQAFCEGAGVLVAALVINVIFSLVHIGNPEYSTIAAIFLFIHGLLYAVAYLKTRSLWTAIGLHMTWNFVQGPVAGMNVSGASFEGGILTTGIDGPAWLTGGDFGIEGSIVTLVVSIMVLLAVLRAKWLKPSARFMSVEEEWKKARSGVDQY